MLHKRLARCHAHKAGIRVKFWDTAEIWVLKYLGTGQKDETTPLTSDLFCTSLWADTCTHGQICAEDASQYTIVLRTVQKYPIQQTLLWLHCWDDWQVLLLELAIYNIKGPVIQTLPVLLIAAGFVVWEEASSIVDMEGEHWKIRRAEILSTPAYTMSTKEVKKANQCILANMYLRSNCQGRQMKQENVLHMLRHAMLIHA